MMPFFQGAALPPSACPACGDILTAADAAGVRERPIEGDFSLCLSCGAVNIFGDGLQLRAMTEPERQIAETMPLLTAARHRVAQDIALYRPKGGQ